MLHSALAAAATLVAVAFALSTWERWLDRRRRQELAWTVALAMFAVAAGLLGAGDALGWDGPLFRAYFFFGAIANVPYLALGTVYLLGGPRRGDVTAAVVTVAVAFAAGVVAVAPFEHPLAADALVPRASEVFGPLPRILAAVASGGGALVLFGGAVWSAWRYRRGRMLAANVLIAAGTAILSASGLLNSVADELTAFVVTLAVGITVIFAGFLVAATGGGGASGPVATGGGGASGPVATTGAGGAAPSPPARGAAPPRS